jgi:hypothetical protein
MGCGVRLWSDSFRGREGRGKDVNVHKSNINLIEHSENIRPSSTERVGPGRDRRINKEVEGQVKGGNREEIEQQVDQVYMSVPLPLRPSVSMRTS